MALNRVAERANGDQLVLCPTDPEKCTLRPLNALHLSRRCAHGPRAPKSKGRVARRFSKTRTRRASPPGIRINGIHYYRAVFFWGWYMVTAASTVPGTWRLITSRSPFFVGAGPFLPFSSRSRGPRLDCKSGSRDLLARVFHDIDVKGHGTNIRS